MSDLVEKSKIRGPRVVYKFIDGAHFFTAEDEHAAGLCAASTDLLTAYNEVGIQLNLIYKHNHGLDAKFTPPLPFDVFKEFVEKSISKAEAYVNEGVIVPSSIQPWMFGTQEIA